MTSAEIRTEILTGPLSNELSFAWSAGDDVAIAAALNRQDRPGYIPARPMVAELVRRNLWGMVLYGARHRLLPNGAECPFSLFTLFAACELAGFGTVNPLIRFEIAPLTAGLSAMIAAGLLAAGDRDALIAHERKLSRAEEVWGYDTVVSPSQIGEARNSL